MSIQKNVAAMMRTIKEQQDLSTAEFSAELEISRSTLQTYLNGTGNPSVMMLDHIAEKLEIDPLVLVSDTFQHNQLNTVLLMFRTTKAITKLPQEKQKRFATLFLEIVSLWEETV